MELNLIERAAYWSFRKVINGYARVFASGLFHLESRQDRFESEVKQVSDVFTFPAFIHSGTLFHNDPMIFTFSSPVHFARLF
jgi:hypothetical protein